MASRAEKKAQLRQQREERQTRQASAKARRKRLTAVAGIVVAAAAIVVVLIVISQGGSKGGAGGGTSITGASQVAMGLKGIPQQATVLGDARAPVTVTEFADLQCPACKSFSDNTLPQAIDRYVRSGKAKIDLKLLEFLGPDSGTAARAAFAAAEQNRLWHFAELMYLNQGQENSGYVTDEYLTGIARKTRGLDLAEWRKDRKNPAYDKLLERNRAVADSAGVSSTPTFDFKGAGGKQDTLTGAVDPGQFGAAIDGLTG